LLAADVGADSAPTKSSAADFAEARRLANRLQSTASGIQVSAGELMALSRLIDALRHLVDLYLSRSPEVLQQVVEQLDRRFGRALVDDVLGRFADEFLLPSVPSASTADLGTAFRLEVLKEILLFRVIGSSPAAEPLVAWLGESAALRSCEFVDLGHQLEEILFTLPSSGRSFRSWGEELWAPSRSAPFSIADQLRFLGERWSLELEEGMGPVLAALDLIAEEQAPRFPPGPGPIEVPAFEHLTEEPEDFSADTDWMPGLVLLAKNSLIWLHQLSEKYGRPIDRLDEIPEQEIEELAARGITGLWLIGVWERSAASKRIKHFSGNLSAEASAYSLAGYRVAKSLGGTEALTGLRELAERNGIRLAADMTPNHLGVDSDWVIHHPDRFLSVPVCPFPSYTFSGPDLSSHAGVGIYLEDHYLDRSDAAVVFKRVDRATGEERFIYHGNDGTSTPWNDTAQLDYLRADTREAVIESILEVARQFSIIRFDAAMTLARKHIQRLWYPRPGHGGAIPSRAEHAISTQGFDELMPMEFWREVVDRIESEVPDTLLLAEALNAKLREVIRETVAFDPRILERYVNFLTNPDEQTAIQQFGDGDRYFGACVVMVTLPGLPMFGHGQFEGHTEKYGMEYGKAFHDEPINEWVLDRHRREIVPLLRRRAHFSQALDFEILDFVEQKTVNENVIAFMNVSGNASAVVVFNNSAASSSGHITGLGEMRELKPLQEGVEVEANEVSPGRTVISFTDSISQRSFLRFGEELRSTGLSLHLEPFEYAVLEGFHALQDDADGTFQQLTVRLDGEGAESLENARVNLACELAVNALEHLIEAGTILGLVESALDAEEADLRPLPEEVEVVLAVDQSLPSVGSEAREDSRVLLESTLESLTRLTRLLENSYITESKRLCRFVDKYQEWLKASPEIIAVVTSMHLVDLLSSLGGMEELSVYPVLEDSLRRSPGSVESAARVTGWARLARQNGWVGDSQLPERREFGQWLNQESTVTLAEPGKGNAEREILDVEALEEFLWFRLSYGLIAVMSPRPEVEEQQKIEDLVSWCDTFERISRMALGGSGWL
jgi:hypothetical protein